MEKEFLINKNSSITLNVTGGKIDSYRRQEETTGTVRVYENGKIGVAGCLGDPDEETLTEQAVKALALGIPYECALDEAETIEEHHEKEIIPEQDFIPIMQDLLNRINEACPRFAISHQIRLSKCRNEYRNSKGRKLLNSDNSLEIELLFQRRGSGNLMDCCFQYSGHDFCPDRIVENCRTLHDAYDIPSDIEDGKWPVIFTAMDFFPVFLRNFTGEMYASGGSLVSGKLGEKIFSEKLTLKDDRNAATNANVCFFDAEGAVAPDYRASIIEHGVLKGVGVSKGSAAQLGLPTSCTSCASYDGVPDTDLAGLYVEPTARQLQDIVPGKAIYVVFASGGDVTPKGHFAAPIQISYLVENGKIVGRLPELNVSGDFFSLLGEDYLGTVHGALADNTQFCIVNMDVVKQSSSED